MQKEKEREKAREEEKAKEEEKEKDEGKGKTEEGSNMGAKEGNRNGKEEIEK